MLDKNNDPVRLYLREMGLVPLLKRQDEVAIAKRMERGHLMVLKSISRSPIVLKELIAVAEDLRNGSLSIKKIIQFDQEELTEEETENKTREVLRVIGKIEQLYGAALSKQAARKLERTPKARKRNFTCDTTGTASARHARPRCRSLVRSIDFHPLEQKKAALSRQDSRRRRKAAGHAEREIVKFETPRGRASKGDNAAEARKELRARRAELYEIRGFKRNRVDRNLKRMLQVILKGEAEVTDQAKTRKWSRRILRLVAFLSPRNIPTAGCNFWT